MLEKQDLLRRLDQMLVDGEARTTRLEMLRDGVSRPAMPCPEVERARWLLTESLRVLYTTRLNVAVR